MGGANKTAIDAPRGKTTFNMNPDDVTIAPPGHFLHDPTSPTTPSEGLVRRIETNGWFGSVLVTKLDGKVYVLLGRERTLAMREVNRRREASGQPPLPLVAEYRVCPEPAAALRLMVAENKGRRQITQAVDATYARMFAAQGMTPDLIAAELEVSEATVRRYLKLAEQPKFVLDAVTRGDISVAKAIGLEGSDAEKREALKEAKAAGGAGAGKGKKREKDLAKFTKLLGELRVTWDDWETLLAAWRAL
jgi:ParB-like chromosome segregation protein Spo0J